MNKSIKEIIYDLERLEDIINFLSICDGEFIKIKDHLEKLQKKMLKALKKEFTKEIG